MKKDHTPHKYKADTRWFFVIWYFMISMIGLGLWFYSKQLEFDFSVFIVVVIPIFFVPMLLQNYYLISKDGVIIQCDRGYSYGLNFKERDTLTKNLYIPIKEIEKMEVSSSWWGGNYIRLWINNHKVDSKVIRLKDHSRFIKEVKQYNPSL